MNEIETLLYSARNIKETSELHDNIFAILKMENKEVSTHSAFINYLLSDRESLKAFVDTVLGLKDINQETEIKVQREFDIDNGRIDFVFWINEKIYAVEMKVWAGEQEDQLERYIEYVKSFGGVESDVYFLTPSPRKAKSAKDKNIRYITFNKEILNWLDTILSYEFYKNKVEISVLIRQYKDLIKRLTEGYEIDMEKIELISSRENFGEIDRLIDARNIFASKILNQLLLYIDNEIKLVCKDAEVKSFSSNYLEDAKKNYYNAGKNWYPAVVYKIEFSQEKRRYLGLIDEDDLYFFIEISHKLYCGFSIRRRNGNVQEIIQKYERYEIDMFMEKYSDTLLYKATRIMKNSKNDLPIWLCWSYVSSGKEEIDFKKWNIGFLDLISNNGSVRVNDSTYLNQTRLNDIVLFINDYFNKTIKVINMCESK